MDLGQQENPHRRPNLNGQHTALRKVQGKAFNNVWHTVTGLLNPADFSNDIWYYAVAEIQDLSDGSIIYPTER